MTTAAQPVLLTVEEACHALDLSRPTVYGLINSGRLRSLTFGRARRIPVAALEEFVAREMSGGDPHDAP